MTSTGQSLSRRGHASALYPYAVVMNPSFLHRSSYFNNGLTRCTLWTPYFSCLWLYTGRHLKTESTYDGALRLYLESGPLITATTLMGGS